MKCPVCQVDMIVVEHKKIELDYCIRCHGVWFDSGEIELLLATLKADHAMESLFAPQRTGVTEKARKCPMCGKKMKKARLGEGPPVLIDTCPQNEGLWFDGGELGRVLDEIARTPAGKSEVVSFLNDVFPAGAGKRGK
ncbi:MAG: zf-TFIIB domain-containing protein [Chloroflexota bacterium]|nr:zf-TFIIB domain-containing protein [Chloroflexota bacterium]